MDHLSETKRLHDRAEECRSLAEIVDDQQARDGYLRMAEAYRVLAENEAARSIGGERCKPNVTQPMIPHALRSVSSAEAIDEKSWSGRRNDRRL